MRANPAGCRPSAGPTIIAASAAGKDVLRREGRRHEPGKARRPMLWEPSPRAREYQERLQAFMDEFIYPNERVHRDQVRADRWQPPAIVEELKARAREAGLWNLFLPPGED